MLVPDRSLIDRKVKLIEEDLGKLRGLAKLSEEEYLRKDVEQAVAERLLERIIGRLIDINYHILTKEFGEMPSDYFDSFLAVAKHGLVEENLTKEVAKYTGLRNILAHEYDEIDQSKVYKAIHTCLNQVPQYLLTLLKKI